MQIAGKNNTSIWLRVDPMASRYPSLSPYVYCANNPIKFVDPEGRMIASPGDFFNRRGGYLGTDGKMRIKYIC